jgi:hypothetical protein
MSVYRTHLVCDKDCEHSQHPKPSWVRSEVCLIWSLVTVGTAIATAIVIVTVLVAVVVLVVVVVAAAVVVVGPCMAIDMTRLGSQQGFPALVSHHPHQWPLARSLAHCCAVPLGGSRGHTNAWFLLHHLLHWSSWDRVAAPHSQSCVMLINIHSVNMQAPLHRCPLDSGTVPACRAACMNPRLCSRHCRDQRAVASIHGIVCSLSRCAREIQSEPPTAWLA